MKNVLTLVLKFQWSKG